MVVTRAHGTTFYFALLDRVRIAKGSECMDRGGPPGRIWQACSGKKERERTAGTQIDHDGRATQTASTASMYYVLLLLVVE